MFHYDRLPRERREGYLPANVGPKGVSHPTEATAGHTEDEEARPVPPCGRTSSGLVLGLFLSTMDGALVVAARVHGRG